MGKAHYAVEVDVAPAVNPVLNQIWYVFTERVGRQLFPLSPARCGGKSIDFRGVKLAIRNELRRGDME
ncbi:MAG: hypothetical protein LBT97_03330 [Planctomycetota bacterium]|jgi:hypothetical protein|nr:hypothetical protein [Planctomycetota bacterium]